MFRFAVNVLLLFLLLALIGAGCLFWFYGRDLPDIETLAAYHPKQVVRIVAHDGTRLGEFGEHRQLAAYDELPPRLIDAFVAAEDQHFFEHAGFDLQGIMRAFATDLFTLQMKQGASTISQQLVKNLFLTPERSVKRKVQEIILAWRIEQRFSKVEIITFYVNAINFGAGAYGPAEAAHVYFDKKLSELSLGELAYLAGVPNSPARYALHRHPDAARQRRDYVLKRLLNLGYIRPEEYKTALQSPLRYRPPADATRAYYVTDEVRRQLARQFAATTLNQGGFLVRTTLDPHLQALAEQTARENLLAYDQRHGYRPLPVLGPAAQAAFHEQIHAEKAPGALPMVFSAEDSPLNDAPTADGEAPAPKAALDAEFWRTRLMPLAPGALAYALVMGVGDDGTLTVDLGARHGRIAPADSAWARPDKSRKAETWRRLFKPGQAVVVRLKGTPPTAPGDAPLTLELAQTPEAQTAMIVLDPAHHAVRAMVGGFSYADSSFNRATQAERQPGSTFKPFTYLAALRKHQLTAASLVVDEPLSLSRGDKTAPWTPKNFDNAFHGSVRVREALAQSYNIPVVKVLREIGVEELIGLAARLGITSPLANDLTLALGSSSVRLIEMANAYATFAAQGVYEAPLLVEGIESLDGKPLYTFSPEPKTVLEPEEAELITSLLSSVVERGTAGKARELGRPVAAKTGTTNGQRDAWFIGYTPQLVVAVWVGFDDGRALGQSETGGRAAIGAFVSFMRQALKGEPILPFPSSPALIHSSIDPATGAFVEADAPGAIEELFLPGTAPFFPIPEAAEKPKAADGDTEAAAEAP